MLMVAVMWLFTGIVMVGKKGCVVDVSRLVLSGPVLRTTWDK